MLLVQQIASGLMLGAIFALVAVAFTLTIGVLNFLNFSIPGIFVVGGMVCWALLERHGLPWYWSVAAAWRARRGFWNGAIGMGPRCGEGGWSPLDFRARASRNYARQLRLCGQAICE